MKDIRRIGPTYPSPKAQVLFGELFDDDEAQQYYEALVGTLKSAKKRGIIQFKGQMLLKGMHDKVVISIVGEVEGLDKMDEPEPKRFVYRTPKAAPKKTFSYMKKKKSPSPKKSPMKSPIKEKPKSEIDGHASDSEARQDSACFPPLKISIASDSEEYVLKSPRRLMVPNVFRSSNLLPPLPRKKMMRKPLLLKRWSDQDIRTQEKPKVETKAPPKKRAPPQRTVSMPVAPRPASTSPRNSAGEAASRMEEEVVQLLVDIKRVGTNPGEPSVKFGELFDDEEVQNTYEALVGTLRSAKRQGLISFKGQMLLKGMHDNVVINVVETN